jgi:hypothetical protein
MVRQYQIVNQDASLQEAEQAVQETDFNRQGGLFQQAVSRLSQLPPCADALTNTTCSS